MGLPVITARNQQQATNKRGIIQQDLSGYPVTYYTTPASKIATIIGTWECKDTGSAATVDLLAASISIAEVQSTGGGTDINIPQDLAENLNFPFKVVLSAGETLQATVNTGDNANCFLNCEVEETPI